MSYKGKMAIRYMFCAILLLTDLLSGFQAFQKVFVSGDNVEISEDLSVNSTVVYLTDFLNASASSEKGGNGTFWSINIIAGDELGRFGVRAEDLALIVAAPLDYKYRPRYKLTLELTNTGNKNALYVTLVIVVLDAEGYPPFYNKRCETPVLQIPDRERGSNHTVFRSDGFNISFNGQVAAKHEDYFQLSLPRTYADNLVLRGDCSLRFVGSATKFDSNQDLVSVLFLGEDSQQGRLDLNCHDRQGNNKGKITLLDTYYDTQLPQWVGSVQFRKELGEDDRYVVAIELNEIWSTSPAYWIRCQAYVTLDGSVPNLFDYTLQYNFAGCPEGRYGVYCDKDCVCENGARCHGFNGACECRPGWRGRACDIPWPEVVIVETPSDSVMKYIGTNLTLTCLAPHIHVANMTLVYQAGNRHNDTKFIEKGTIQNSSISFQPILESANGRYSCTVQAEDGQLFNATFVLNATNCRPNYYGEDCSQVCDCEYGGTCDRWEGCLCPPGRHGDRCEHICAPGTFGLNCSMKCYCQNNATCNAVNGSCICAEGQSGEFCQIVSIPNSNQVVVLASVFLTIAIIGCVLTGILVKRVTVHRRPRTPEQPSVDSEMTSLTETLSSWEVEKEDIHFEHMIGEGKFGHVVRARLRVPEGYQVLVAAKSIRPDQMTASAVRDFRREMAILTRIHENKDGHPNVVKLYGVVTKSEPQYILVEYASNEELRRYLWSLREHRKVTGNSKLLERLGFACDVACGLSELTRLKIVHRDIAARNVVISDRKIAKIADFGLARDIYESSAYERASQGGEEELLPLKWMALESLRDGVYTCESDVWSYGVLLWEIASFGEEPRYAGVPCTRMFAHCWNY
ncbi:uncharacterized protein LOC144871828 [Branchiostoma floridae x Branchiostoma japonicum]